MYTVVGGSAVGFTSLTSSGSILTGINMPAGGSSNMTIRVRDYLNSSVKKIISVETDQIDTSGNPSHGRFTGAYGAPAAIQKVRVIFTTGSSPSFTGGSYRVYGVKKP
jgi:hypothetical protein